MNKEVYNQMQKHNSALSKYACPDQNAIFFETRTEDIRTPFFPRLFVIVIGWLLLFTSESI